MKKIRTLLFALTIAFAISSCYTLEHTVGSGAKGNVTTSKRQWYILWGLVPLNEVNSKDLAGGAANYNVRSQHTFVDGVISAITGIITVSCQSVMVTK
jgi:hypothetical protein